MSDSIILSGGQVHIGESECIASEGIAPERTKYPVKVTLLSGEVGYHDDIGHPASKMFIIELASVQHNDTVIATYNHNAAEIIGTGQNLRIEGGALVCDGFVIPFRQGDRADELSFRAKNGTPFEASIEFTPAAAERETIGEGETVLLDGIEYPGPINVYRNVNVRAYSLCPLGSVQGTGAAFLSATRNSNKEKNMSKDITAKLSDDSLSDDSAKQDEPAEGGSAYPDLDELQKMFGDELGVRLFKDNISLEDAKKVFEFNEKYNIVPKPAEGDLSEETAEKKEEIIEEEEKKETASLKASIVKLSAAHKESNAVLVKLADGFAKLSAKLTLSGESDGVSTNLTGGDKDKKSFADITKSQLDKLRKSK